MANKIILKRSSVAGKAPITSDLDYGELSINYTDGTLYYKNSGGSISTIGSNIGNTVVSGNITANTAETRAIFANVTTTNGIFWANGVNYSTGLGGSGSTYANANVKVYLESLSNINIGVNSGLSYQSSQAVAIGDSAGQTLQCARAIAVGVYAGKCSQDSDAVAIGTSAGKVNQNINAIAIGKCSAYSNQGANAVAIGATAGNVSQGGGAVAIGTSAGRSSQGLQAVAIGGYAGSSGQSASAIAIGVCAAAGSQGGSAIAIGNSAGNCGQGANAVAIGATAGNYLQGTHGIAIGYLSGHCAQGSSAIAIGRCAGFGCQQTNAVAIGYNAGQYSQGACAVALGRNAGQTSQVANSIAINASGTALNPANAGFYVSPVRSAAGSNVVVYNTTTNELTYTTLSTYSNSNVEAYIGANIGAYQTWANANAATQATSINTINANLGSYQTYANTAVQTLSANIGTLIAGAPGALDTLYEIDQALGNNASFSATMVTWLGNITTNVTTANTSISTLNANLGAYQIYANANIGTLFNGNTSTNANLGAFQLYANANIGTLFNGNTSTNANLGAFQTYANTKIGTNTNSNLVVLSTTPSTTSTTGALVVGGGVGIAGNAVVGGNVFVGLAAPTVGSANVQVYGGNLAAAPGSTLKMAEFNNTNTNANYLQILQQRHTQGADWTTANTRIGVVTDVTKQGYIEFNPLGSQYGIDLGTGTAPILRLFGTNNVASNVVVTAATASTTATTGALVVNGGVGIGGNVVQSGWHLPSANLTYNLGSTTAWWNIFYGKSVQAQYADLAEIYTADYKYSAGTVVVFGGTAEVSTTAISHDTRVAGVVSTDPAYLMNSAAEGIPVAMTGRVPCQVRGPVTKGTVLVTSDTPGVAEAIDYDLYRPGAVLGKSLGEIPDSTIQTIEVVVGRF